MTENGTKRGDRENVVKIIIISLILCIIVIMLYIIKAFDIIVQDQWLVMTLGFYKKIFPETADCEGWKNRGFNNKNQLVRIVLYPFLCMMTAGMFVLFG